MMPLMSGYEVCERLKSSTVTKDIPVIFMSALDDEANEEKGLLLGAADYIRKPFSIPITKARIRNYLELKAHQDKLKNASLIDPMTNLANRRHFDNIYERECARVKRVHGNISCLMIDIDNFKNYNDNYGHPQATNA
jgi:PleD family two-component response regulator